MFKDAGNPNRQKWLAPQLLSLLLEHGLQPFKLQCPPSSKAEYDAHSSVGKNNPDGSHVSTCVSPGPNALFILPVMTIKAAG